MKPVYDVVVVRSASQDEPAAVAAGLATDFTVDVSRPDLVVASRALGRSATPTAAWAEIGDEVLVSPGGLPSTTGGLADVTRRFEENDSVYIVSRQGGVSGFRSVSGRVPVYHWSDGVRTVVATSLRGLLATGMVPPRTDELVEAMQLNGAFHFPYGRGLVAGSRVVPRGHHFNVTPDGKLALDQRWFPERLVPEQESTEDKLRWLQDELRNRLLTHLDQELEPQETHLLLLSGGLDSSSLAILIGRRFGRELDAFAVVPADGPYADREASRVRRAVEMAGIRRLHQHEQSVSEPSPLVQTSIPVPIIGPFFPRLIEFAGVYDTLIGGEHADDVCGGAIGIADWARTTTGPQLARDVATGSLPNGVGDLYRWRKWRATTPLRVLPYPVALTGASAEVQAEYASWREEYADAVGAWRDSPRRWLRLTSERDAWLALYWELAADLGMRRVTPFMERGVLEIGYQSHPRDVLGPGRKLLLREALRGLVPDVILDDPGRGNWLPRWRRFLPHRRALVAPGMPLELREQRVDAFRLALRGAANRTSG